MATSETPSSAAGAAPRNQLDQAVDRAIRDAVDRYRGNVLAELHAGVVAAVIEAVCQHLRDSAPLNGLPFDQLDPRLSAAIDDYLSGHRTDNGAVDLTRGSAG